MEEEIWPRDREPAVRPPRLCFSIHGAYHAMMHRLHVVVREVSLGPSEAFVLMQLARNPMSPPSELRQRLGLRRSTLSSILDRLESAGLLTRERSTFDGRRFELQLTAAGQTAADHADELVGDLEDEVAMFISPTQRRAAAEAFLAMIAASRPDGILDV